MTEDRFNSCIREMNRGNTDALKEVYEEYVSYIYTIVRRLLQNREEAEDITSDFFIRLWEKAGVYKPGNGHRGWMATIARNLAIDYIRKHKREELADFSEVQSTEDNRQGVRVGLMAEAAKDVSVEDLVLSNISIQEALTGLKEAERQIIHMKIMGELTFQEIADILEEPPGTVAWRYREALKKLRRCGYE